MDTTVDAKDLDEVSSAIDTIIRHIVEQISKCNGKSDLESRRDVDRSINAFWDIYRFTKCYSPGKTKEYERMLYKATGREELCTPNSTP